MSEYQYYEFRAIDKALSNEGLNELSALSSRVELTKRSAIYTYSYGDFRGDVGTLMEKYFDAMLYMSSYGNTRLMFKVPNALVDLKSMRKYRVFECIHFKELGQHVLIDLDVIDEEGGRWIEGEGWLSHLIDLRDDLVAGDYRCLYLIWLKLISLVDFELIGMDPHDLEPPVPAKLNALNDSLHSLVQLFEIDQDLIAVAADCSLDMNDEPEPDLSSFIKELKAEEKDQYLHLLLKGEPYLSEKFRRRLADFVKKGKSTTPKHKRRSIEELLALSQGIKAARALQEKKKAEAAHKKRMTGIEKNADQHWQDIDKLISQKQTKAYDEAVKLLEELKELAIYKGKLDAFLAKVDEIISNNSRLPGLISRIQSKVIKEKKQGRYFKLHIS